MESTPNYYANIPADVRYSNICANAKLLYGEISALCNKEGYCWATNKYFADLYDVSNTSVSLWIKQLKEKDFIEYEVLDNYTRKIYLKGVLRKVKGGIKKSYRGVLRKVKDNTTVNNTNIITSNIYEQTPSQLAKDFFEEGETYISLLREFGEKNNLIAIENEFKRFALYWTEPNKSGTKQRWQMENTFEIKRRLMTWLGNVKNFNKKEKLLTVIQDNNITNIN